MNNRVTSDSGNPVNLFPFLAVLLCTMGALLVLLVVLADRAGKRMAVEAEIEASQLTVAPTLFQKETGQQPPNEAAEEAAKLVRQLDEVHTYQQKLSELRKLADQRLQEEKQRLSHLEDHTRRLEDELLQLARAAKQLEATEKNQSVDQYQAERELVRLQQLVQDNESKLEEMREQVKGKKSYAIVPFEGKDGTTDPRIYIECCKEGIILQPEGIRFEARDFMDKKSAANPLVAAIRATQEHLSTLAKEAGKPNPPMAIPLFLVRSDGDDIFYKALSSFKASGERFGVDYLNAEGILSFPTSPDPILATKQHRAVLDGRAKLERNMKAQPSRFRKDQVRVASLTGDLIKQLRVGNSEGERAKAPSGYGQAPSDQNQNEWIPESELGNQTHRQFGETTESLEFGALSSSGNTEGLEIDFADDSSTSSGQANTSELDETKGVPGGTNPQESASMEQHHGAGNAGANTSGSTSSQSITSSDKNAQEAWALKHDRSRSSVPLQRPIQVEVGKDQFAFLPSRGSEVSRREISMLQSTSAIAKEFVASMQERADEWGIAGIDLHWKPVLYLHVRADATDTAVRLVQLLSNSGVEVRISENNRFSRRGPEHATR